MEQNFAYTMTPDIPAMNSNSYMGIMIPRFFRIQVASGSRIRDNDVMDPRIFGILSNTIRDIDFKSKALGINIGGLCFGQQNFFVGSCWIPDLG